MAIPHEYLVDLHPMYICFHYHFPRYEFRFVKVRHCLYHYCLIINPLYVVYFLCLCVSLLATVGRLGTISHVLMLSTFKQRYLKDYFNI